MSSSMSYKKGDFVIVPSLSVLKGLNPITQTVYMWLCIHANNETGECYPAYSTLAKECGCHRSTVISHVKKLQDIGLIKKVVRKSKEGSNNTSNLYVVQYVTSSDNRQSDLGGGSGELPPSSGELPGGGSGELPPSSGELPELYSLNYNQYINYNHTTSENEFSREISLIIDLFKEHLSPSLKHNNTTQKKAICEMIERYGCEEVLRMAREAVAVQGQPYAPVVTTPHELYAKFGKLRLYFQKMQEASEPDMIPYFMGSRMTKDMQYVIKDGVKVAFDQRYKDRIVWKPSTTVTRSE